MSVTRHHADWLSLIESSGPFISLPVLMRVFPQGLEPRDPAQGKALRSAYEEWHDNPGAPGKQRTWLLYVLTAVLGYPAELITEGQSMPAGMEASMPEMGETLRPDYALVGSAGSESVGKPQLLIASYPHTQALDKPVIGKHWKATASTRMMELLHGANVPLGLVSNGEQWMLVYAPRGETTGYTSWYSSLWMDEPITLRAFHSLLGVRRFFGVAADSTLLALLKESASDQQEVTDQLGYQVREAVEVLVQSFDALDRESGRFLLTGVTETKLYEAALTIMMRLVFLFSAEERGLLHLGKPLYDDNYAVSTLQEQLQEVADRYGEEVLERRFDAWARLLATFRAVHGGVQHQDLLMQAYGGSLFDPDRYPFLEGRSAGTMWHTAVSEPLTVNNRVVLHLLNSLQRLRTKVGTGTTTETRRVSFRALGVEQIGHVYEGLLDHTAVRATEPVLGIKGTRTKEPEIPLSVLEVKLTESLDKFFEFLKDETGRSVNALRREFEGGGLLDEHKLLVACDQDDQLVARLRPFAGLIREDSFERPLIVLSGSVYVTAGTDRRSSGTHYTPPSLTDPIVQHTLEPLVYEGPAEGLPRDQWNLKSPKEILDLKVCDMAMGSGAFLVQACRYLAERLVEAWENAEKAHPGQVLITPDGKFSEGLPSERLVPTEAAERIAIARRVAADRCLYGVDINPMAVEMAKLSLWLITVDSNRPFTFLDHAFKCGDSLLGITSLEQLENFSLRPGSVKQQTFATLDLWRYIEEAKKKREILEAMPSDTPEQIAAKAALYAEAEDGLAKLRVVGDILVALNIRGLGSTAYESARELAIDHMMSCWSKSIRELEDYAGSQLSGRKCFHWALAFPEICSSGGFSSFIGNPPYLGGTRISTSFGEEYTAFLKANTSQGGDRTDLVAYFFRRSYSLLSETGTIGFVTTNTVTETDTARAGLGEIINSAGHIYSADTERPWPGTAGLHVVVVYISKGAWNGLKLLDDQPVSFISEHLTPREAMPDPFELRQELTAAVGAKPSSSHLVISESHAVDLGHPNLHDIIRPYLTGDDINSSVGSKPSRFAIYLVTRSESDVDEFPRIASYLRTTVKPERVNHRSQRLRKEWWQFEHPAADLLKRVKMEGGFFAVCETSKHLILETFAAHILPSNGCIVFPTQDWRYFGVIQSSIHEAWARRPGMSKLETRPRYNANLCFATFPFCFTDDVGVIAKQYQFERARSSQLLSLGLTDLYNFYHNPVEGRPAFSSMRNLHKEMDQAVAVAYGWQDMDLGHNFHETKQGVRFTISEAARREMLDRLLALNHQRHAEELAAAAAQVTLIPAKRGRKKTDNDAQIAMDFELE